MTTELILIRHGQSHANVRPVIGGMRGDVGLTDLGVSQCSRLGRRLSREELSADVLYASTLPRAQQTAGYVARALALPVLDDDELQEVRPGAADDLSRTEWQRRWPRPGRTFHHDPYLPMADDGESWATFVTRACAGLTALVERHPDQRVVAVTHGGVIEASFYLALGLGVSGKRVGFSPANTSLTRWSHDPSGDPAEWTLLGFNDVAHLAESDPVGTG